MPIALTEDRRELSSVARSFLADRDALGASRALLDAPAESLPAFWVELCGLGWTGLHLPEAFGGSGYGLSELVCVIEELGRVAAPGPFLATVAASATIDAVGSDAQKAAFLPGLAEGSVVGALGLGGTLTRAADGTLSGASGLVLAGGMAHVFVLQAGDDLVIVPAADVTVTPLGKMDPTRRVVRVSAVGTNVVPDDHVIVGGARVER